MRSGCRDFINGKPVELMTVYSNPLDIHHIFPKAWCEARGIPPRVFNSIVNRTALSAESNRAIGGSAPLVYLARVEKRTGLTTDQLDDILRTHLIEPTHLRYDDFDAFFAHREQRLAQLAADAMGKAVVSSGTIETGSEEVELSVDEEETLEEIA